MAESSLISYGTIQVRRSKYWNIKVRLISAKQLFVFGKNKFALIINGKNKVRNEKNKVRNEKKQVRFDY